MNENNQMIKYEKESWWKKLKNKFFGIFSKKKKNIEFNNETKIEKELQKVEYNSEKQDFFELYSKVKNNEIDLSSLDKDTLYKVMTMVKEELQINNNTIDKKVNEMENSINNIKMYNKEIELINKKHS